MPNFDGGHYFYTGLFPVSRGPVKRRDGSITVPSHLLREALASLPNFSQVREEEDAKRDSDRISPFARCRSTHFARLAVIDNPAFNGRDPTDPIADTVKGLFGKGVDLLEHQPVDHLSRPWLLFTADFDAVDAGARDRWAAGLWQLMETELKTVFEHCRGFSHVDSPAAFAAYLARGQLETTMSFSDYWIDPMNIPSQSVPLLGAAVAIPTLLFLAAAAYWRWWPWHWPHHWWPWQWDWGGILLVLAAALLGLALGAWLAYKMVMGRGAKPFPPAPDSDLKSVLKGLFLQQRLARFAIAQQGAPAQQLYDAFATFLQDVRPDDLAHPTQPPGVLRS